MAYYGNPYGTPYYNGQPYGQVAPYGQTGNFASGNQQQQYAPVQPPQPQRLNGHVIQSPNDVITPDSVPMDGTVSYFPVANGNSIIAKYWSDQGIQTREYALVVDEQPTNGQSKADFENEVLERLEVIEQKLSTKSNRSSSSAAARRSADKKEG